MQTSFEFQVVDNHNLLYEEIFSDLEKSIHSGKPINGLKNIVGIERFGSNTDGIKAFKNVLARRNSLLERTQQSSANETLYRQRLITPLLTEVLGYSLELLDPEEFVKDFGHVDDFYKWDFRYLPIESKQYGRIQGDNFLIKKQSNADPIYQTTNYLKGVNRKIFTAKNTDTDCPYAILTDGLEWRLYAYDHLNNDTQPSCLVVRLDQINLENEQQLTQAYLWMTTFFSETATRKEGILDQILSENTKRASAIKDQLGKQVYDAVEYIAKGIYLKISQRPEDKKSVTVKYYTQHFSGYTTDKDQRFKKVLYHESLVYLFRIIFGLYAEDRGLLDAVNIAYGLKNGEKNLLSDIRQKFASSHGGQDWKSNDHHIKFFDNEDRKLETFYFGPINEKYNGGLFDPKRHPLLADFDINDRYFLRAIDFLLRTQDPHNKKQLATVSYAQLDVRHLGTIYENLLEFSLVTNEESDKEILPLKIVNDKGERKATGSYYTPDYIVEYIVQQTVGVKIDKIVDPHKESNFSTTQTICEQIMELNICDPAMGSGHFLIEVVEYIHRRIATLSEHLSEDEQETIQKIYNKSHIASQCVYGVDINYLAVELAKVVMWIKTFDPEIPLQFLDANLKRGNSLIGTRVDKMFASENMQKLNQLFNDMKRAEHKSQQAVQAIAQKIDAYISGASSADKDIETQKKQVQLKYKLFQMLSKRFYHEVTAIPKRLGDNLPELQGKDFKEKSKIKVAHLQSQREALDQEYQELNPFKDRKELRDFYLIGLASYNAKYLLTVPLALEFLPESRDAINLGYESQVRQMLGGNKTKDLALTTVHLPNTTPREEETAMTVQQAVDSIIQNINPFHWELEFPTVFAKGGFDCVVGNPPYVSTKSTTFDKTEIAYYQNKFHVSEYQTDLYPIFMEHSLNLLNTEGEFGYIIPNSWLNNLRFEKLRNHILEYYALQNIVIMPSNTFKGATVDTVISIISHDKSNTELLVSKSDGENIVDLHKIGLDRFTSGVLDIEASDLDYKVINKYKEYGIIELDNILNFSSGIKEYEVGKGIPKQTKEDVHNKIYNSLDKKDNSYIRHIVGSNISNYILKRNGEYLSYGPWLGAPRKECFFQGERLVIREIPGLEKMFVAYTNDHYTIKNTGHIGVLKNDSSFSLKTLLALLNSRFYWYVFRTTYGENDSVFPKLKLGQFRKLRVPNIKIQQPFVTSADKMITFQKEQYEIISSSHRLITRRYEIEKLSRKLEKFRELDFTDFLKELQKKNKQLKSLKPAEEQQLEEWFLDEQKKILDYQTQIDELDREIDEMVFDLYGLTEEEREIVLGS